MQGSCFCGEVRFEISGRLPDIYQCHCSECRKVTGAAANAGCIVNKGRLRWLSGHEQINSFVQASGYRVDFCRRCGSTVPNLTRQGDAWWIPVGLLDEVPEDIKVVHHIYVGSKAHWDLIPASGVQHEAGTDRLMIDCRS